MAKKKKAGQKAKKILHKKKVLKKKPAKKDSKKKVFKAPATVENPAVTNPVLQEAPQPINPAQLPPMGKKDFIAKQSILINTSTAKVWDALVNPSKIKQYLFGTDAVSDWKIGSPITYRGEWQGKSYKDKGKILNIVPEKILESTYWSGISGLADVPENYNKVTYELKSEHNGTILTVTQDNNPSEESQNHSEQNWKTVLESLKKLVETESP